MQRWDVGGVNGIMPMIVETPGELVNARQSADSVGLVPTMGALHVGHLALIDRAARENEQVVVSIFVNPTQFENPDDLDSYPRQMMADIATAGQAGANVIYTPAVETIYPCGFGTTIQIHGSADNWEGASRPGHFAGVATVVTILLNHVRPDRAYFGEKDFQQLAVIKQLQRDLALPVEIIGCPTVRDTDGLALSSRNAKLSPEEHAEALAIPQALFAIAYEARRGTDDVAALLGCGRKILDQSPQLNVDYLAIVEPRMLRPLDALVPGARAILAATIGETRLIDNVELMPSLITTHAHL